MSGSDGMNGILSRRDALLGACFAFAQMMIGIQSEAAETPPDRYDFLSKNGNSSCGKDFLDSIATMKPGARLQGSCCSPMERTRYVKQVAGLIKYRDIVDIPPDPYDIDASLAQKLLKKYDLVLTPEDQKAYDFAIENSAEQGPCCCRCWRWKVYGGLGKLLIREHGFDGKQVTEVWNLSDGCGGVG